MAKDEVIAPSGSDSSTLLTNISSEDLQFRFAKDSTCTEGNNFLMFADNGCFAFVNVLLVSALFKKHQLALTVKVYDQKFECKTITRNYDGKDDMKLSNEKLNAEFAGYSIAFTEEPEKSYHLVFTEKETAKEGPKVEGEWLNIKLTAEGQGFKLGDGKIYYGKNKEDYAYLAFGMPRAKVSGSIHIEGVTYDMAGYGFVSKNFSNMFPHKIANTFHHCKLITPEITLASCIVETPKSFGREKYSWGFFVDNGNVKCVTTTNSATWLENGVVDPKTKYLLPQKVQFDWSGKTVDDKDFKAALTVDIKEENLLCKFDVLQHVPAIFRVIVEKLIARPFLYQYYETVKATVTIDGEAKEIEGRCLHEYHFIND